MAPTVYAILSYDYESCMLHGIFSTLEAACRAVVTLYPTKSTALSIEALQAETLHREGGTMLEGIELLERLPMVTSGDMRRERWEMLFGRWTQHCTAAEVAKVLALPRTQAYPDLVAFLETLEAIRSDPAQADAIYQAAMAQDWSWATVDGAYAVWVQWMVQWSSAR